MKIPFTLEAWLKDKSQRVETRDGRPARIICTDAKADDGACVIALIPGYGGEEAYQFFPDGHAFSSKSSDEDCTDLFIITPEPELSEFEDRLRIICENAVKEAHLFPHRTSEDFAKKHSAELLDLARKELQEKVIHDYWKQAADRCVQAREEGKAEALKDLPKWRVSNTMRSTLPTVMYGNNGMILYKDGLEVSISDLEKLPKEDESHE